MIENGEVEDLDTVQACQALADAHRALVEVECRQLVLAAHWIDLHGPVDEPDAEPEGPGVPGAERVVRSGADGTPQMSEFACAEFAAVQEMHPLAGRALLAKVANLRHRHPLLWGRVLRGEVRGWKALEVARIVGKVEYGLSLTQARWVDEQTAEWIDALPWGSFSSLVEARIVAVDPQAAEARRAQAAAARYVTCGRTSEQGLKTFIASALAGAVIRLVALCDRIAEILAADGDTDPVPVRRSKALGIIANPARALALLGSHAHPEQDQTRSDEGTGDLHPSDDDADDADDAVEQPSCPAGGLGDLAAFVRSLPAGLLDRILPKATLYVHVTEHALATGAGVARVEGVGPTTLGGIQALLVGSKVTAVKVLDVAGQRPVDAYEFPADLREATFLVSPRDVFPFAPSTSRRRDLDHPVPYLPPARGGPPGQTHLGNVAPMARFHHRPKTHGGWRLRQTEPGSYLWRSPHGHTWLTTPTGTHRLPSETGRRLWHALDAHPAIVAHRTAPEPA